ncbi:MAG: ATP synthase F1 subunit gamma [Pirellulales bacterium]|nr:ATP synthase F1 subunit gamma [Pirellulales bacterium]
MAKARALDRRRKSIRSIRKITRTMELISRARFKKAMDRAIAASAYTKRMTKLVGDLVRSGLPVSHPLLLPREETNRAILLVLTANRGLCGGYNGSIMRLATARYRELRESVAELKLEVSGKRGISALKFRGVKIDERYTHFEDKPAFEEVNLLADRYLDEFTTGRLDRLDIAYTKFISSSRQQAVVETLLPLAGLEGFEEDEEGKEHIGETPYEFLPSAASILDEVVPASFKVKLFKCFLDAAVSEQIARMVSMKAATENADEMIGMLSTAYNRARQGQITGELLEIIGGAEALNE